MCILVLVFQWQVLSESQIVLHDYIFSSDSRDRSLIRLVYVLYGPV